MKISRMALTLSALATSLLLAGCNVPGERVEVPPAHVGKVMTKDGYKEGLYTTSKFRLDACIFYCDKLTLLDISDHSLEEPMELFMPRDKLNMKFDLRLTLTVNPEKYDSIFERISPDFDSASRSNRISLKRVYTTYAKQIVLAEAREFLSQYSIDEVASSRETINNQLAQRLTASINERTPFLVRYVGIADIQYPDVIVTAQINSAERREMIRQEQAQLEVSKVQLERQLQEQRMLRAIEVEKAETEAQVNKILADSVTPEYIRYRSLNAMDKIAESQNKVFVPTEMLSSMAGQVMMGNAK